MTIRQGVEYTTVFMKKNMIQAARIVEQKASLRLTLSLLATVVYFGGCSGSSQATPIPVKGVSLKLCAAVDYNNANYHDNMDVLAKKALLPDGYWNRYHEDVVRDLCHGDAGGVASLIDEGSVSAEEAARLKSALTDTPAVVRSDAGRSYGFSKKRFIEMGLCSSCADNVAQWYVQKPTSRCGMLAKHSLEGDPDAIKALASFPLYCTWEYK